MTMTGEHRGRPRTWPTILLAVAIVGSLSGAGTYAWYQRETAPPAGPATTSSPAPSDPTSVPSVDPQPVEPALVLPNRDFEAGDKGPGVRILQRILAGLDYDVGEIDGRFGGDTHHAVVAFQKVQGLGRDGVVGKATRKALADPVVPVPRHPNRRGTSIEVDLDRQVLYLLQEGDIGRIVDVSTGGGYSFVSRGVRKVAITVTGEYEVYLQYDGWYESSVGPMYKSSFYLRGFAIHGSKSVPPFPASHGCVRVTMSSIERLWPKLHLGTKVSVYRD